jgi:two-component system phosphate regulon sensor histidine kinase PhoR
MWPVLIFIVLAAGVIIYFGMRERRHRRERARAQADFTREALRQQQQAIAQGQAQQQALVNSMLEGVLLMGRDGRIQLINRSLSFLFNLTTEVRGMTVVEALRWPALEELIRRVANEKQVIGSEVEFPGPPVRVLQANATAFLDSDLKQEGAIFVFHDITRLKQLENTRREFVANVSHELRTPLTLINGFIETLLNGAKDDPVLTERFLQKISKHADRLTFLIEDLLTISKLESSRISMNRSEFDLHLLAEKVVADLASKAAEKSVTIRNGIPLGLRLKADADRLEEVFVNLIENAIKYGNNHGQIVLSANRSNGITEVSVADDGPGIPPESCERIFERFYRVDQARSRDAGGTGLGLAIVKHIVQAHGGEVRVASQPGHRTTFTFSIPDTDNHRPI